MKKSIYGLVIVLIIATVTAFNTTESKKNSSIEEIELIAEAVGKRLCKLKNLQKSGSELSQIIVSRELTSLFRNGDTLISQARGDLRKKLAEKYDSKIQQTVETCGISVKERVNLQITPLVIFQNIYKKGGVSEKDLSQIHKAGAKLGYIICKFKLERNQSKAKQLAKNYEKASDELMKKINALKNVPLAFDAHLATLIEQTHICGISFLETKQLVVKIHELSGN